MLKNLIIEIGTATVLIVVSLSFFALCATPFIAAAIFHTLN